MLQVGRKPGYHDAHWVFITSYLKEYFDGLSYAGDGGNATYYYYSSSSSSSSYDSSGSSGSSS